MLKAALQHGANDLAFFSTCNHCRLLCSTHVRAHNCVHASQLLGSFDGDAGVQTPKRRDLQQVLGLDVVMHSIAEHHCDSYATKPMLFYQKR